MGMLFRDFVDLYFEDMGHRLKESTIISKRYLVDKKILPVFGKIPINEITPCLLYTSQTEKINYYLDLLLFRLYSSIRFSILFTSFPLSSKNSILSLSLIHIYFFYGYL